MARKLSPEERLKIVEDIAQSGNVRAACEKHPMDASTYYKLIGRLRGLKTPEEKLKALADRSRKWNSHGQQTKPEERRLIRRLAVENPSYGCNQIQRMLKKRKIKRSATTVQKIMTEENLGTAVERWLYLDAPKTKLSTEQRNFVEVFNPSIRDLKWPRHETDAIIDVSNFDIGPLPNLGGLVAVVAVERRSSFAFGSIREKFLPKHLVWVIKNRVQPALVRAGARNTTLVVPTVTLGMSGEDLDQIATPRTTIRKTLLGTSGSMQRFQKAFVESFTKDVATEEVFDDTRALRAAFKSWLTEYNNSKLDGFPNYGRPPAELFFEKRQRIK
jgi:transposase-like protein